MKAQKNRKTNFSFYLTTVGGHWIHSILEIFLAQEIHQRPSFILRQ